MDAGLQIDLEQFHECMCQALEVKPGHGSLTGVAKAVGTTRQWYKRALNGESTTDQLLVWATRAGLEGRLHGDGKLSFSVPRPATGPWVVITLPDGDEAAPEVHLWRSSRALPAEAWRTPMPRHLAHLCPKPPPQVANAVPASTGASGKPAGK